MFLSEDTDTFELGSKMLRYSGLHPTVYNFRGHCHQMTRLLEVRVRSRQSDGGVAGSENVPR